MTARAFAFCVGDAPIPWELATYRAIERFGVKAVTGKDVLTYAEIHAMRTADIIVSLYQQREASGNVAEWTNKNPKEARILEAALRVWQIR